MLETFPFQLTYNQSCNSRPSEKMLLRNETISCNKLHKSLQWIFANAKFSRRQKIFTF